MDRGTATVEYGVNIDGSAFSFHPNDQLGQSNGNLKHQLSSFWCTQDLVWCSWSCSFSVRQGGSGLCYDPDILSHIGKAGASALIAEKTTMFPPNIFLQHNVPVHKAVQMAGEYVITFPRAYHAGFSQGFNCGEVVNFAFGDWFHWGAVAGQVYAHSCRMVIVPSEELLCKEAIILSKSSNYGITETASESCVRSSFVTHIESLNIVLWRLHNLEPSITYSAVSQGTIICQLRKRDCYLTFLECSRCFYHTCIFHGK
ncbi:hypothetical protein Goshw_001434 [Gossypium schwendimanii]|uniref:JmjC domain-containing protein n=1 Tax=Gossypium schwendimanii TaxID=34291 RepID=A0A7J9ND46_GOSSC|nr:hypothetical protein [Gossypium schwendimanii]